MFYYSQLKLQTDRKFVDIVEVVKQRNSKYLQEFKVIYQEVEENK